MKKNEKHLSLRIEEEMLRKFEYVARYDERSMNWMLNALIRKCIEEFEAEHGKIVPQDRLEELMKALFKGALFYVNFSLIPVRSCRTI